jgi:hypothetical protein
MTANMVKNLPNGPAIINCGRNGRLPHPEHPSLAATFPHYHEPPDIKNNRQPAPGITFAVPNLPRLIADCLAIK